MSNEALPWRRSGADVLIDIRLTPKAAKDGIDGLDVLSDGRSVLKARVRAVPEKGSANKALTQLMAKSLGLPKSSVSLDSGSASRLKTVRVSGNCEEIESTLTSFTSQSPA